MWIEASTFNGEKVLINTDNIIYAAEHKVGTRLFLVKNYFRNSASNENLNYLDIDISLNNFKNSIFLEK